MPPSGQRLNQTLDSLHVNNNPKYQPKVVNGKKETYCNVYVHDATTKLGAPIPQMRANEMNTWLKNSSNGWKQVSPAEAQKLANQGKPVVGAWSNPNGHGHVVMVRPGTYSAADGPHVAQAGSKPTNFTTLSGAFKNPETRKKVGFFSKP